MSQDDPPEETSLNEKHTVEPVGRDLTFDVIDLVDSDDDDESSGNAGIPRESAEIWKQNRVTNRHPRAVLKALEKRKRATAERKSLEDESGRRRDIKETTQKRKEIALKTINIPEGCNFVIIDDDNESSEKVAQNFVSYSEKSKKTTISDANYTNTRFLWPPSYRFDYEREFNYQFSRAAALEMQERMFQESAARVRERYLEQTFHTNNGPNFHIPMPEIADKYPDHWLWKNPFACLGLPNNAALKLVKLHYRALARRYHPDKSRVRSTSDKFHAITTAYRRIMAYINDRQGPYEH